jgi:hypothetical protein
MHVHAAAQNRRYTVKSASYTIGAPSFSPLPDWQPQYLVVLPSIHPKDCIFSLVSGSIVV